MKTLKSISIFFTVFLLVLCCTGFASTAANVKLSKKKVTIIKGNKTRLKLIGTKRSIKWRVSNKKIISIKKIGKYTVIIRGKKAGTTYVTAKAGKKKYRCRIKVQKRKPRRDPEKKYKNLRKKIYKQLGITKNMKPQYICFLLARWECEYLKYGTYDSKHHGQTYQEAFDYRKVVCGGYSDLYEYMLDGLGIENVCVRLSGWHGWNAVKIDGHWYYVDVTWMDDKIAEWGTEKDHVPCYDMRCFLTHIPTYTDFIIDPYDSGKHKNYTVKEIKKSTNTRFYKCFVDAYNACYKENKTVESLHCGSQWCYFDSPWITGSWVNY